jgi:hypothetical protein
MKKTLLTSLTALASLTMATAQAGNYQITPIPGYELSIMQHKN